MDRALTTRPISLVVLKIGMSAVSGATVVRRRAGTAVAAAAAEAPLFVTVLPEALSMRSHLRRALLSPTTFPGYLRGNLASCCVRVRLVMPEVAVPFEERVEVPGKQGAQTYFASAACEKLTRGVCAFGPQHPVQGWRTSTPSTSVL